MAKRSIPYLVEREGRYWARVVVPSDVREVIGTRELRHALGADRGEAMRNLPIHVTRFRDRIRAARRGLPATPPASLPALAHEHYAARLTNDETLRADHRYASIEVDDLYVAALRDVAAGRADDNATAEIVGPMVDAYRRRGVQAIPGTPEWRKLARTVAAVELERFGLARNREF